MLQLIVNGIVYPVFVLLIFLIPTLYLIRQRERARRSKLPTWKELGEARELLKKGGTTQRLQTLASDNPDVILIGSGLGSLSCAAILAKAGLRVLVLERHDVAGGSTHTFTDGGYEFDVGIHYVGARLDDHLSPVRRLFSYVSDGRLEFTRLDSTYDVALNASTGESIGVTDSGRETRDGITRHFARGKGAPGVSDALERYRTFERRGCLAGQVFLLSRMLPPAATRRLYPYLERVWLEYGARPAADVLSRGCGMVGDGLRGLAGVVTYCYGDYGVRPAHAPWFVHALVSTHYRGGAFFPTGGSSSIAKTLVATIVRNGGDVLVRAPVDRIVVEGGRAVGVVCRGVRVEARVAVVSGAGFRNTFGCVDGDAVGRTPLVAPEEGGKEVREMLQGRSGGPGPGPVPAPVGASAKLGTGPGYGQKTDGVQLIDRVGASCAMVYLFVGLDRSDEELGIRAQNIWVLKDWNHDAAMDAFMKIELPADGSRLPTLQDFPCIFLASASAKDGDWTRRHPNRSAMIVLAPVRPEWFAPWAGTETGHRGESYARFKNAWRDLLLGALHDRWPRTRGRVVHADVGTPLTNDRYLASVRGEVYALENTVERYRSSSALCALHPETPLPGLFLTGQDTMCVGVVTALFSGWATACRISYISCLKLLLGLVID